MRWVCDGLFRDSSGYEADVSGVMTKATPMSDGQVDQHMLYSWLSARSIARGLPAPVPDYGGYRVDTNSAAEIRRWVFSQVGAGLVQLGHSINQPRHFLKLCDSAEKLRSILPARWQLSTSGYFMQACGDPTKRSMAAGYTAETERRSEVVEVRIRSGSGELAASGYAVETQDVFIYDRIVTTPQHRRKGLGSAVMATLHQAKQSSDKPELLVATEDGRALYTTLGWRLISLYSTASTIDAERLVSGGIASP